MPMNIFQLILKILGLYKKPSTTTTTTPITIGDENMDGLVKAALCIGINQYPNPANNLAGCVNDANDWAKVLNDIYNFDVIKMLLNSDATLDNVRASAEELLASKPDVFVITDSSHGTRIPDSTEADGYCEAICLYDKFLIDHDFHKILEKADPKTKIVVISDSCHSAGVTREFLATMNDFRYASQPKYLPHPDNQEAFKAAMSPTVRAIFEPTVGMNEVLVAGCKSDQYSYDASFDNRPNGAFTYYTIKCLRENPNLTYNQLIQKLNEYLPSSRYPQCPVLETDEKNKDLPIFG
jgi:metacaspase-1